MWAHRPGWISVKMQKPNVECFLIQSPHWAGTLEHKPSLKQLTFVWFLVQRVNCRTNSFRCALRGIDSSAFAEAEAFLNWNNTISLSPPWKPPFALPWKSRDLGFSPSSACYSLELWRAEWDVLPVQAALKSMTVTHILKLRINGICIAHKYLSLFFQKLQDV